MSFERHDDDCPGCRPALLDAETRQPLPKDSPQMKIVMKVWGTTTLDQRRAFHNVTCNNSREADDLKGMSEVVSAIEAAFKQFALN